MLSTGIEMEFLLKFPPPPEAPSSSSSPADEDGDESPDLQATHHLIVSMFKCITKAEDLCLSLPHSLMSLTLLLPVHWQGFLCTNYFRYSVGPANGSLVVRRHWPLNLTLQKYPHPPLRWTPFLRLLFQPFYPCCRPFCPSV